MASKKHYWRMITRRNTNAAAGQKLQRKSTKLGADTPSKGTPLYQCTDRLLTKQQDFWCHSQWNTVIVESMQEI